MGPGLPSVAEQRLSGSVGLVFGFRKSPVLRSDGDCRDSEWFGRCRVSRARESESLRDDHQRSFAGAGVRRFREAEPSSRPISGLGRPIPAGPPIRSIPSLRSLAARQPAQASTTPARPLLRPLSVWLNRTEMVIYRALVTAPRASSCSVL